MRYFFCWIHESEREIIVRRNKILQCGFVFLRDVCRQNQNVIVSLGRRILNNGRKSHRKIWNKIIVCRKGNRHVVALERMFYFYGFFDIFEQSPLQFAGLVVSYYNLSERESSLSSHRPVRTTLHRKRHFYKIRKHRPFIYNQRIHAEKQRLFLQHHRPANLCGHKRT